MPLLSSPVSRTGAIDLEQSCESGMVLDAFPMSFTSYESLTT